VAEEGDLSCERLERVQRLKVQRVPVSERLCALHTTDAAGAAGHHRDDERPKRRAPHLSHRVDRAGVATLWARFAKRVLVCGVNEHPGSRFVQRPGQPDVIAVRVGEDQAVETLERSSQPGQVGLEAATEPGQTGVHRGEAPIVLDQVPVDRRAAESVHASDDVGCDRRVQILI